MVEGHQGQTVVQQGSTGRQSSSWIVMSLMMMTGSHTIRISQSISCKFMFLPLIICIVPFTQPTKIWLYQAKEVMVITASHIRTETLLDCFID